MIASCVIAAQLVYSKGVVLRVTPPETTTAIGNDDVNDGMIPGILILNIIIFRIESVCQVEKDVCAQCTMHQ